MPKRRTLGHYLVSSQDFYFFFFFWSKKRTYVLPKKDVWQGQGPAPLIDMLGPPINKLTLLKTTVYELNFKLFKHELKITKPIFCLASALHDLILSRHANQCRKQIKEKRGNCFKQLCTDGEIQCNHHN